MLRVLWVGGYFFGTLPFVILIEFVLAMVSARLWAAVSRGYYRSLCKAMRVRITVQGTPPSGQALIVSNHVSWADIAVFSAIAPVVFVAKREVGTWPLIGLAARAQKTVFVDRERRHKTGDTIDEIAKRLADGHPVVLFAEGTSSDGNRVLPFRSALVGAIDAASRNGAVTVQPAAISYTRQYGLPMGRQMRPLAAWYGDLGFFPHFAAFLRHGAVDAVVSFAEPIAADPQADRKTMTRALETRVRGLATAARQAGIPIATRAR